MNKLDLIKERHAVRQYVEEPLNEEVKKAILKEVEICNEEGNLHIQLVNNEPKAFSGMMAHYGRFSGVTNYFAMIGKKEDGTDEKIGYYGERLVLKCQELGLNSCWVALTYKKVKTAFTVDEGEKLYIVIAIGKGKTQGNPHKSKPIESLSNIDSKSPSWFIDGVNCALLAPTAMNEQKFYFELKDGKVIATTKKAMYANMDLGIAKYHFEIGANKDSSIWVK